MRYAATPGGLLIPAESPLVEAGAGLNAPWRAVERAARRLRDLLLGPMLAGFGANESEDLVLNVLIKRVLTDRDANLNLALFTNAAPGDTITQATLTRPTGTGYAAISLTDASWSGPTSQSVSYAEQTFTAGAGGWTGSVQGYDIETIAAGGTPRIVVIEVDGNGPYTFAESDTYAITPTIGAEY